MKTKAAQKSTKRRIALGVFLFLVCFMGELLLYTWCRVQCVNVSYALTVETRRQQSLKTMQNNLKIELARLKAPENLSRIARRKLALGMPEAHQIVTVP
jgi:cell division protein FtsL